MNGEKLVVYNWGEYIDPEVLTMFEEETGIDIVYEELAPIQSELWFQMLQQDSGCRKIDEYKIQSMSGQSDFVFLTESLFEYVVWRYISKG